MRHSQAPVGVHHVARNVHVVDEIGTPGAVAMLVVVQSAHLAQDQIQEASHRPDGATILIMNIAGVAVGDGGNEGRIAPEAYATSTSQGASEGLVCSPLHGRVLQQKDGSQLQRCQLEKVDGELGVLAAVGGLVLDQDGGIGHRVVPAQDLGDNHGLRPPVSWHVTVARVLTDGKMVARRMMEEGYDRVECPTPPETRRRSARPSWKAAAAISIAASTELPHSTSTSARGATAGDSEAMSRRARYAAIRFTSRACARADPERWFDSEGTLNHSARSDLDTHPLSGYLYPRGNM